MKHFSIKELSKSATAAAKGIDNTPTENAKANLTALVNNILDPLREAWGRPIIVNSGYRGPKLNKAVGGVASSHHLTGQAADITAGSRAANKQLFFLIQKMNLPFDQLIHEKGTVSEGPDWIHVSYDPKRNRRQIIYKK